MPKGNQFSGGPPRKPFRRKDEVTRETIIIAFLYAALFACGMYGILQWYG